MTINKKRLGALGIASVGLTAVAAGVLPSSAETQEPAPIAVELLTPRSRFTDGISVLLMIRHGDRPGPSSDDELLAPARRPRAVGGTQVVNVRDPSNVVTAEITVQPEARFPLHTHAGPVMVTVSRGELTYIDDGCVERVYPAGTAFVDPGRGNVHTAYNSGSDVAVLVATFLEVPAEGPLTITDGIEARGCEAEAET